MAARPLPDCRVHVVPRNGELDRAIAGGGLLQAAAAGWALAGVSAPARPGLLAGGATAPEELLSFRGRGDRRGEARGEARGETRGVGEAAP